MGVQEYLIVDPRTRAFELFRLEGGRLESIQAETVRISSIGVTLSTIDGPTLRLAWDGGTADV